MRDCLFEAATRLKRETTMKTKQKVCGRVRGEE